MRTVEHLSAVPLGSVVRHVDLEDDAKTVVEVRYPDGKGWECCGEVQRPGARRWHWCQLGDRKTTCTVLAEGLTSEQCDAVAPMTAHAAEQWCSEVGVRPDRLVGVAVLTVYRPASGRGPVRTLMCRRLAGASDGVGMWSCPGGCLEADDADLIAAATRELVEETGLVAESVRVLPIAPKEGRRPNGQPYVTVYVEALFDDEDPPVPTNPEPHKHSDWEWLTAEQVAALTDVWDQAEIVRRFGEYEALEVLQRFGDDDAAHHKAWVIDQALRALLGAEGYAKWVAELEAEGYEQDVGIAP